MNVAINAYIREGELPRQQTPRAAEIDLVTPRYIELTTGESTVVDTHLEIDIPEGYFGLGKLWSSLAKIGLTTDARVIDQDYMAPIKVILVNCNPRMTVNAEKGDRIAHLIVVPYLSVTLQPRKKPRQTTK